MFIEIEKKRFELNFGNAVIWLRFDNSACLEIERSGFNPFDIKAFNESGKAARVMIKAGLRDWARKLDISPMRLEAVVDALLSANTETTMLTALSAITAALPDAPPAPKGKATASRQDIGSIYTAFCDVMHRSDADFWHSTLREVVERWDRYATMKGYKEAPIPIQKYDDE